MLLKELLKKIDEKYKLTEDKIPEPSPRKTDQPSKQVYPTTPVRLSQTGKTYQATPRYVYDKETGYYIMKN